MASDAGPPGIVTCDRIERVPTHQNLLKNFQKISGWFSGRVAALVDPREAVASHETHLEVPIAQERAGATGFGWLPRVGTLQRADGACIGTDPGASNGPGSFNFRS